MRIPFLRPRLVEPEVYLERLRQLQQTRRYSNFGPLISEFEQRVVQQLLGARGAALAVCNATIGLMLAIAAVRRPRGRYALMPSFTFAATPLAAQWCGLTPYFVDARRDEWCMDESALAAALATLGDEAAVVVTYATFGAPIDLRAYARLHGDRVPVVIDAAPSLGSMAPDGPFASGFPGPVVYSLHATKAFAVGEGGLIYSGDRTLVARLRRMSNFGFDEGRSAVDFGLNAKLPETTAALALATLDAFREKMSIRERLYAAYATHMRDRGLLAAGWQLQRFAGRIPHQFMPALCPPSVDVARLLRSLADRSIEARTYFSPACHQQPRFAECPRDALVVTEWLTRRIVSLPMWEEMSNDDVEQVVDALAGLPAAR
jgi:dTDP-4-amino-4,6-dideoxygalactose transaminase